MTTQFAGINVPGVNFSQPEQKKEAFFTDYDSDLRENRAFPRRVCSLEVGVNFQDLQFTFSELPYLGKPTQDTYDSDFWVEKYMC